GSNNSEFPLIIATENNTEVFVNGSTTPFGIINQGEFLTIPSTFYQGGVSANMYIESSKPVYVYQVLAGSTNDATSGLNFIPQLSCFFQKNVDLIPDINRIGNTFYSSDVFVLTTNGSTISINETQTNAITNNVQG